VNTDREQVRRIAEANDAFRTGPFLNLGVSPRLAGVFCRSEGLPIAAVMARIQQQEFPENTASPAHDFAHLFVGGVEVWWRVLDEGDSRRLMIFLPDEYSQIEDVYRGWL